MASALARSYNGCGQSLQWSPGTALGQESEGEASWSCKLSGCCVSKSIVSAKKHYQWRHFTLTLRGQTPHPISPFPFSSPSFPFPFLPFPHLPFPFTPCREVTAHTDLQMCRRKFRPIKYMRRYSYETALCKVCMYKVSSRTFTQNFVTARLSFRERQIFVTGHSVLRHSQELQTKKHGQPHTIQSVRAHARDLTMAAAGHACGMARAAPGIIRLHRMHEMQSILTDVHGVCPSVCHAAHLGFTVQKCLNGSRCCLRRTLLGAHGTLC